MKTLTEFAAHYKLTIESKPIFQNPHQPTWQADHWQVKITKDKKEMVLFYSKGTGLRTNKGTKRTPKMVAVAPKIEEVLECLLADSSITDYPFPDWCLEMGGSEDSVSARENYDASCKMVKDLKGLLGSLAFSELRGIEL